MCRGVGDGRAQRKAWVWQCEDPNQYYEEGKERDELGLDNLCRLLWGSRINGQASKLSEKCIYFKASLHKVRPDAQGEAGSFKNGSMGFPNP